MRQVANAGHFFEPSSTYEVFRVLGVGISSFSVVRLFVLNIDAANTPTYHTHTLEYQQAGTSRANEQEAFPYGHCTLMPGSRHGFSTRSTYGYLIC